MYWLTGLMGLILAAAPFVFGFSNNPQALWTSLIVGSVLMVSAALEGWSDDKQTWEYWVMGVAGVGAIFAPFVLGFYGVYAAAWSLVIIGVVTVISVSARLLQSSKGRFNY